MVTIISGDLIAGPSQAANLDLVPRAALAIALFTWALGVTTGVATWGAAYHAVVAQVSGDQEEQTRSRRMGTNPFHSSLAMFLMGLIAIGLSLLE